MKIFGQPFWRYQLAYTAHSAQYHWPSKRAGPKNFNSICSYHYCNDEGCGANSADIPKIALFCRFQPTMFYDIYTDKRKERNQNKKKFTATKIKLFLLLHKITTNKKTAGKSDVQNKSIPAQNKGKAYISLCRLIELRLKILFYSPDLGRI